MKHQIIKIANTEEIHRYCPLPLGVIPNHMGINLCNVETVEWVEQDDGQLVSLTINFNPDPIE